MAPVRASLGLVGAGLCLCPGWSGALTWGDGTVERSMVRRRSTVRFRKGAPAYERLSNIFSGYLPVMSAIRVALGRPPGGRRSGFVQLGDGGERLLLPEQVRRRIRWRYRRSGISGQDGRDRSAAGPSSSCKGRPLVARPPRQSGL
jgi:hypothetical protein